MRQVREAVTNAAQLLSQLKRKTLLDDRDRSSCDTVQTQLEAAEKTLYGQDDPPTPDPAAGLSLATKEVQDAARRGASELGLQDLGGKRGEDRPASDGGGLGEGRHGRIAR